MRRSIVALGLVTCLLPGCTWWQTGRWEWDWWPFDDERPVRVAADPSYGVAEIDERAVVDFYGRAQSFYGQLALRRFNVLSTFRDEDLRDFFRNEVAFADYYADLAQDLTDANFERNRPLELEVVEFSVDGPGEATVFTKMVGENSLPLRWGMTEMERVDRWERIDGTWWIIPAKL